LAHCASGVAEAFPHAVHKIAAWDI